MVDMNPPKRLRTTEEDEPETPTGGEEEEEEGVDVVGDRLSPVHTHVLV